jgi:hypothetical protein
MMKKLYVVAPLVLALTACGSIKYNTGVEIEGPGKRMFSNEVGYPSWYTAQPDAKDKNLYAVASEESDNFQFAVDRTMLSAKRELAANFSSYTSAMMKDFAYQSGTGKTTQADIERTTKMVVAKVNLIGVQRDQFKVVHEKDGYRAFVRLKYSADESNRLLMQEIKRDAGLASKFKASKAFRELEEEVNRIEAQKVEQINATKE